MVTTAVVTTAMMIRAVMTNACVVVVTLEELITLHVVATLRVVTTRKAIWCTEDHHDGDQRQNKAEHWHCSIRGCSA
jgi:hypothetical protein